VNIKALQTSVEQVYGVPIKYGNQCQQLIIAIFEETNEYISFQTLRRFFGFIKTNNKTSNRTLDILSKYCGYIHFNDFCTKINKTKNVVGTIIESVYNIPVRKEKDLNFHYVCRNLASLMYHDLLLVEQNISFLANSTVAHEYLFERFVFIDHLHNPIYKRALLLYKKAKNTLDANFFVDSILYLANFLLKNKVDKLPLSLNLSKLHTLHPFLQARVLGSYLIAGTSNKNELIKLIFDTEKTQLFHDNKTNEFAFFHWMMADYFIICKLPHEARKIIELSRKYYNAVPTGWLETGYHETFDLLYAICLEATGEKEQAKQNFEKLKQQHFHFIFSKYFTIRYLNLKNKLFGTLTETDEKELNDLYSKTKFKYLK